MTSTLRIIVPPHPIIAHWLMVLRNPQTPESLYSTALEQMGKWLAYEALRDWLPYREEELETPNGKVKGTIIDPNVTILSIPTSAGGIHLWLGARDLIPNSELCIGGIPSSIKENSGIMLFIDQIAAGDNLIEKLKELKRIGIQFKRVRVLTALCSKPGLQNIGELAQDLTIYSSCIDPELTDSKEISPGIGNPSLRISTILNHSN